MAKQSFPGTDRQARPVPIHRMVKRRHFLQAKSGKRAHKAPFVLQAKARGDDNPARIGITVTRKTGVAATRNRIKRRLKHAISNHPGLGFRSGYDYVLIARTLAVSVPFEHLTSALQSALETVHRPRHKTAQTAS